MASKMTIEHDPYLTVSSMTEDDCAAFVESLFGIPRERIERIEDHAPAVGDRYKPGARIFHVYLRPKS